MPVEIYLTNPNAEPQYEEVEIEEDSQDQEIRSAENTDEETSAKETEAEVLDEEGKPVKKTKKVLKQPVPLNDTTPLWKMCIRDSNMNLQPA